MTEIPKTPTQNWTLETAIKQLEFCEYEAIGGSLVWNDAFIWLKNIHTQELTALREEVENMKFCANCKHGTDSTNCGRVYFVLSWSYRCEKGWQSDSLTAEQRRK